MKRVNSSKADADDPTLIEQVALKAEGPGGLRRHQRLELLALSPGRALSIAGPSKEGIFGPLHRWSERRTTRIGERALSILQ